MPPPGPGEVRVRAIASALSQGTEMLVYRGQVPADLPLDLPTLAGSFAFPIKYGYATVGRVVDAGPGVVEPAPGDTVFVHHPHQTVFVVPAGLPIRLPTGLDPLCGLFTANLEATVNVLLDMPLRLGETALVFGQGTVGLLLAQLLRRAGAGQVIGVDPLARRREVARAVGVDVALEPGPDLPAQVRALTGGRGADVALEASGAGAALQAAIDAVADEGTVMVVFLVRDESGHARTGRALSSGPGPSALLASGPHRSRPGASLGPGATHGAGPRPAAATASDRIDLAPAALQCGAGRLPPD